MNVEFRAADATANPYLALAALVMAGLDGLRHELPVPALVNQDPSGMQPADLERLGVRRLPGDLPAALAALHADALLDLWLPTTLRACLMAVKTKELALTAGLAPAELCARYAAVY
jgi:glutamine synthetase